MNPTRKGIILAVVQLALVASLGAKYAIDRARFPRVWVQTAAYDPDLPIRGRYLSVRLRVDADQLQAGTVSPKSNAVHSWGDQGEVTLRVEGGRLVAYSAPLPTGLRVMRWRARNGDEVTGLSEPVDYFLPEHAIDPSRRQAGEELWIEVTVPAKGPPRPIRLAVKRGDTFTPLELK